MSSYFVNPLYSKYKAAAAAAAGGGEPPINPAYYVCHFAPARPTIFTTHQEAELLQYPDCKSSCANIGEEPRPLNQSASPSPVFPWMRPQGWTQTPCLSPFPLPFSACFPKQFTTLSLEFLHLSTPADSGEYGSHPPYLEIGS
ncbi:PREDICTED: homeobox protein Hox-D8 [Thamnophis sirtalis]|uniref:Homeobox protein Hox-D8 n=1 Tax=Thamnophis sirtalis TaxID=35019 RepID=A0A6I9YZA1_9SAUR|nr:PREDICTED: homeobox protein Hox-D8 [Thamnophis sirtalis]